MFRIIACVVIAMCISTVSNAQEYRTPVRTTARFFAERKPVRSYFSERKPVRSFLKSSPLRRAWYARPGFLVYNPNR